MSVAVGNGRIVGVAEGNSSGVGLPVGNGETIAVQVADAVISGLGEGLINVPVSVGVRDGVGVRGITVTVSREHCKAAAFA